MLNKRNFEIAKLANKVGEEAATVSQCILVAPDKTVVTDGHLCLVMSGFEHSGDILPFDDMVPQKDFEPFPLKSDDALSVAKVFVNSDSLEANLIGINPDVAMGAGIALKQPQSEKVFRVERPECNFPQYEIVFPHESSELGHVTLSLELLIPLLQQMAKVNPCVRLGYYGTEMQVRFDSYDSTLKQSARAVIMPMKEDV